MKYSLLCLTVISTLICNIQYVAAQYNSPFEEDLFSRLEEGSVKSIDLLNAINYNQSLYEKGRDLIDGHIKQLKANDLDKKPLKKQIKTIYKSTHATFLTKYEEKANFSDIFKSGTYNCVTASALYAIILDEFGINYSVRETPDHVYLIADTSGLQTLIESTLPGRGVLVFNEKFKKDYVAYLHNNKLISDQEFHNSTTDNLFKKYYSKDKRINLQKLGAIQYYNKGVFLLENKRFIEASTYLRKALVIYPSNKIRYNHFASVQNALYSDFNSKRYDGISYGHVANSVLIDSTLSKILVDYFISVSQELCINTPDIERYEKFYNDIISICPETDIPSELLGEYHQFRAYHYGSSSEYVLALKEIKKAYDLQGENLRIRDMAQSFGVKHLFLESRYKSQIDSMDKYFSALPFLINEKYFQQQYTYYHMKVIIESFMYGQPQEGKEYYNMFLAAIDRYNIENFSEEHISMGLGYMVYYYANKNQTSKAKEILEKGLELTPGSLRLRQIQNEIKDARRIANQVALYESNRSTEPVIVEETYDPAEELKQDVYDHFPGRWKAVAIIIEDMEQKLTKKEVFQFVAEKNKKCTYTANGISQKGKWAYRKISRCIYFVPDRDKDSFLVFKVKEASSDKLVLLPYKDQRTPSPYRYVLRPIQ